MPHVTSGESSTETLDSRRLEDERRRLRTDDLNEPGCMHMNSFALQIKVNYGKVLSRGRT